MRNRPHADRPGEGRFHKIVAAFLTQPGLAFARWLSAERVSRRFTGPGNMLTTTPAYGVLASSTRLPKRS